MTLYLASLTTFNQFIGTNDSMSVSEISIASVITKTVASAPSGWWVAKKKPENPDAQMAKIGKFRTN